MVIIGKGRILEPFIASFVCEFNLFLRVVIQVQVEFALGKISGFLELE